MGCFSLVKVDVTLRKQTPREDGPLQCQANNACVTRHLLGRTSYLGPDLKLLCTLQNSVPSADLTVMLFIPLQLML